MTVKKEWNHDSRYLVGTDADELYRRMMHAPWTQPDASENTSAINYGRSYQQGGGARSGEIPTVPEFLKTVAERIAQNVSMPSNYVQCHRMGPAAQVRPHRDPSGMVVPMLTLGMERTFRIGGDYSPAERQTERPVECHIPAEEIVMRHGDLLTFNGGRTAHSMFTADKDPQFNPNGHDFRISILFRWTTGILRTLGPDRRNWSLAQLKQHETEYAAARDCWMEEHQAQPSLF